MCTYSLINLLLDKLKSAIKISSEIASIILSKMVSISNSKNNFPCKLLLTDQQIVNFVRLLRIICLLYRIIKDANKFQRQQNQVKFLGRLLGPLTKTGLPLMQNMPT